MKRWKQTVAIYVISRPKIAVKSSEKCQHISLCDDQIPVEARVKEKGCHPPFGRHRQFDKTDNTRGYTKRRSDSLNVCPTDREENGDST
ncbi:unnamed protein product [Rodentolepis nana]|uniref:Ovule protein n=1 Tax=Rodentolepis nana TaxID=102285 RepID=A0A0R3TWF1_RODNA|nr:unnamed protein product [Rodentolepis nana]